MFSIVITFVYVASVCGKESSFVNDGMGQTDKNKMSDLALILLKDAKLKVRQVTGIREEHSYFVTFDIGVIIGKIREKYKRMMEVYKEAHARYNQRVTLQGPGLRYFRPLVCVIAMEIVHSLEVDIDNLVNVLEKIPKRMLVTKKRTTKMRILRSERSMASAIEEEEYKSKLREQYTLKKLGINKTRWAWDISCLT